MDQLAQQEIAATAAVHTELGQAYDGAVAEGLVERISSEIDKQVDARLAQRDIRPSWAAWANVAMGLGSVGLGIGATALVLRSWPSTGVAPKAVLDLGSFHASLMTSTNSISTAQVVLIVLIWAVIAVVNIVYARRRPGRL
jgi:urease alpha subunit